MAKSVKQKSSVKRKQYKAPKQGGGQFAPTEANPVRQHYKMATEGLK